MRTSFARLCASLALLAMTAPARAEPHKLLVLQADGRADAAARAKIGAGVVKLAKAGDPQAAAGDITYTDAATAVGCKPELAACKDEVIGMLAVDEIAIVTVTPKPGGLEVDVRRVAKNGATRGAQVIVAADAPGKLDGLASLFGAAASNASNTVPLAPAEPGPVPTSEPLPAPAPTVPRPEQITSEPAPPGPAPLVDNASLARHRYEMIGMVSGGGMVLVGLLLWGAASSTQGDIDKAPTRTAQDLHDLKDLESRGDSFARWGNVFAIGGVVIGGVATYYYLRDRRREKAQHAHLAPAVFDHGGGLAITFGGAP